MPLTHKVRFDPYAGTARAIGVVNALFRVGLLIGLVTGIGCDRSDELPVQGTKIGTFAEVAPDALPYSKGALILAGTAIPVEIARERTEDRVIFSLIAHKQTLETETYSLARSGFAIESAAGESYLPPIPLLRFPMTIGEAWIWNGEMSAGDVKRSASATIKTSDDTLNLPGVTGAAIKIDVQLSMDSGGPEPAKRRLLFWVLPKMGVVRREFGASSTRLPAPEGKQ